MIIGGMYHMNQSKRWKLARMRAEEAPDLSGGGGAGEAATAADTGAGASADTIQQPAADGGEGGQSAEPIAPDYEKLFAEPEAEPAAAVDPNAPAAEASAIPEAFKEALAVSEYVKEPQQMAQAVRAASELWDVETGKIPVGQMLEGFRARNPEGFEKIARESLIPYIETITGMKLMDPAKAGAAGGAGEAGPKTPEQERIERVEQQLQERRQAEERQVYQQNVQRADAAATAKLTELTTGTFLEGKAAAILPKLAPYLGKSVGEAMKEILAGNTSTLEKAFKAYQDEFVTMARSWSRHMIAESKKLKTALPAGKGNVRSGEPDLETMTRDQKIQYLSEQPS